MRIPAGIWAGIGTRSLTLLGRLGLGHGAAQGQRGRDDRGEGVGGRSAGPGTARPHLRHRREHLGNANCWFNKLGTWGFKDKQRTVIRPQSQEIRALQLYLGFTAFIFINDDYY